MQRLVASQFETPTDFRVERAFRPALRNSPGPEPRRGDTKCCRLCRTYGTRNLRGDLNAGLKVRSTYLNLFLRIKPTHYRLSACVFYTAGDEQHADCEIGPMTQEHWEAVRVIYQEGIATGNATFETLRARVERMGRTPSAIVQAGGTHGNKVLGWAALSPVSSRCVYGGVAEVSIYVAEEARGQGIGRRLLAALVEASDKTASGRCKRESFPKTLPVSTSISRQAFESWAVRERIGCMDGTLARHRPDGSQKRGGRRVEAVRSIALYQGTTSTARLAARKFGFTIALVLGATVLLVAYEIKHVNQCIDIVLPSIFR